VGSGGGGGVYQQLWRDVAGSGGSDAAVSIAPNGANARGDDIANDVDMAYSDGGASAQAYAKFHQQRTLFQPL
jgi:hypothetical protein